MKYATRSIKCGASCTLQSVFPPTIITTSFFNILPPQLLRIHLQQTFIDMNPYAGTSTNPFKELQRAFYKRDGTLQDWAQERENAAVLREAGGLSAGLGQQANPLVQGGLGGGLVGGLGQVDESLIGGGLEGGPLGGLGGGGLGSGLGSGGLGQEQIMDQPLMGGGLGGLSSTQQVLDEYRDHHRMVDQYRVDRGLEERPMWETTLEPGQVQNPFDGGELQERQHLERMLEGRRRNALIGQDRLGDDLTIQTQGLWDRPDRPSLAGSMLANSQPGLSGAMNPSLNAELQANNQDWESEYAEALAEAGLGQDLMMDGNLGLGDLGGPGSIYDPRMGGGL